MSQIIRHFLSKMNVFVLSRRSAPRFELRVPITITLESEKTKVSRKSGIEILSIKGQTKDLSESGIAFFIDSIRLREHYLIGENRLLDVTLDLPNGSIEMQVVGVRYEQFDIHNSVAKYFIGAQIKHIEPSALELYREYLRLGDKAGERELPALELDTTDN